MSEHPLDYSLLLFDLDGTVRGCIEHGGAPCHNGPGQWNILPNTLKTLAAYNWATVSVGFCTNQAGIGLGYVSEQTVRQEIHKTLFTLFPHWMRHFPEYWPVYRYAPAAPDASSPWRKPSPLMLLDLVSVFEERLDHTLYVGDSPEDEESASRAGCHFMWAWQFFNRPEPASPNVIKAHEVAVGSRDPLAGVLSRIKQLGYTWRQPADGGGAITIYEPARPMRRVGEVRVTPEGSEEWRWDHLKFAARFTCNDGVPEDSEESRWDR